MSQSHRDNAVYALHDHAMDELVRLAEGLDLL